jgi:hypothetical protein
MYQYAVVGSLATKVSKRFFCASFCVYLLCRWEGVRDDIPTGGPGNIFTCALQKGTFSLKGNFVMSLAKTAARQLNEVKSKGEKCDGNDGVCAGLS